MSSTPARRSSTSTCDVVDQVLEEIGVGQKPRLLVLNKVDLVPDGLRDHYEHGHVAVSALRGVGLDRLLAAVAQTVGSPAKKISVTLPSARGDLIAMARRDGEVLSEEYSDGVVAMRARVSPAVAGRLRKAALEGPPAESSLN